MKETQHRDASDRCARCGHAREEHKKTYYARPDIGCVKCDCDSYESAVDISTLAERVHSLTQELIEARRDITTLQSQVKKLSEELQEVNRDLDKIAYHITGLPKRDRVLLRPSKW